MRRFFTLFILLLLWPLQTLAQDNIVMATVIEHPAPSDYSLYNCGDSECFWNLPMGILDEDAIWAAMMKPVTVVSGEQRQMVKLYAQPDTASEAVGEVTCESQGLHILETLDNGWALVEAYSSSVGNSKVNVYAKQVQGYIKTDKFKTITPKSDYGLVIDKQTQRMYIFQDGKYFSQLLISTGIPNDDEPFNETPAGEFLMVSRMGGFWSGNMYCDMGMRINAGIAIHEVPCLINAQTQERNYKPFEVALGRKASHGCIRVQREENAQGVNMRWVWKNIKVNTKVLIWDDANRPIPKPDYDMPVFYNPQGGKYYHMDQYCPSVKDRYLPLEAIVYGELDDKHAGLSACPKCHPPLKLSEINAKNAQ